VVLGVSSLSQGRLEQAKSWLDRAERAVRPEVQPAEGIPAHYARGAIKLACGREHEALAAFRAAERLAGLLVTPHPLARWARAFSLHAFLRLGETGVVESALVGLDEQQQETAEMRSVLGRCDSLRITHRPRQMRSRPLSTDHSQRGITVPDWFRLSCWRR
jgi:LuxR family maltose regulon positive regulatory protein